MFIVEGLPNKCIPIPPQAVLKAYLEGNTRPLTNYLKQQLSHPYVVGIHVVSVDVNIMHKYVYNEDLVRRTHLPSTLLIYTAQEQYEDE